MLVTLLGGATWEAVLAVTPSGTLISHLLFSIMSMSSSACLGAAVMGTCMRASYRGVNLHVSGGSDGVCGLPKVVVTDIFHSCFLKGR